MPRVLLVDDERLQLLTRAAILSAAGFEVCTATSADAALALLRSTFGADVHLVVTDHIMPQATGAEFVRRLRQVRPGVAVIVISGLAEARDEYAELGVIFREKPCPPAELVALARAARPASP